MRGHIVNLFRDLVQDLPKFVLGDANDLVHIARHVVQHSGNEWGP